MKSRLVFVVAVLASLAVVEVWFSERPSVNSPVTIEPLRSTRNAVLEERDGSLAMLDRSGVMRAWNESWDAALTSRRWDALIAVGDDALRLGDLDGAPETARANARLAYRAALIRARASHSVEGTLRVADAFANIGDFDAAEAALRVARQLVASNPDRNLRARVELDASRIAARVPPEP